MNIHCRLLLISNRYYEINLSIKHICIFNNKTAKQGIEDPRLFRLLNVCTESIRNHPDKVLAILAYVEYWVLYCLGVISHLNIVFNYRYNYLEATNFLRLMISGVI